MSEYLAQWADLYYIDFWANNIHYLWKLYNGDPDKNRTPDWKNKKKPKVVVRAIDWEVWIGLARDQAIINWVDEVIVIAPHIELELRRHADFKNKIHLIRPGVDLSKFTLKQKQTDGFQIGMVLGDMWVYKNNIGGLNLFQMLVEKYPKEPWKLHIRGQHEPGEFNPVYYNHFIKSRNLQDRVILYPPVEDMNLWYENIDILVHPGLKEAFCYAVGEAMAKGIKPVINTFYGSEDIWDRKYRFYSYNEAVKMIKEGTRNPLEYRKHIQDNYSLDKMLAEYDSLLGT